MRFSTLSASLFVHTICFGQSTLYKQTNKIMEYQFAVADSSAIRQMSESEKIKFELKYVEKSYTRTINSNYESNIEVKIDSNDFKKDWMTLPSKYRYTQKGIDMIGSDNLIKKTYPYSSEDLAFIAEEKLGIEEKGFHPGIITFPSFDAAAINALAAENILVSNMPNGEVKVTSGANSTIYNNFKKTIVTDYIDGDGIKCRETLAYEPYGIDKGFLLKIKKLERFVTTNAGKCITETRLTYYTNYEIADNGNLVNKAMDKKDVVKLYPNPNDGVFTASVALKDDASIASVSVIHAITGSTVAVNHNNQRTFLVNLPNLTAGNYVLQVVTNNQRTINTNFIKN
ncbi:MAG: T9SS type A sorting domain-containing protein [Sphingobacteriales bacterium]|nr:T9SS type A sorting domain-containing protein [Sphingobacteriales bacterium]